MTGAPRTIPRILVVDDNEFVIHALSHLLRSEGWEPVCFYSAAPALEFGQRETPAAAIVDIHLPDGSGLDLTRDLRERWGDELPIVILSGDTSMATIKRLPELGATYFAGKPANAAVLMRQLREWVNPPADHSETRRISPEA